MIKRFEVFQVEQEGDVMFVIPQGSEHSFRYQTVHHEYNAIYRLLDSSDVKNLVVDFSAVDYLGSVMIGVIIRLSRRVSDGSGKVVLCECSSQMREVLESQNLHKLWPIYPSRKEALQALHAEN